MCEFLWRQDMADTSVFIMKNVDFENLRGNSNQIRKCYIIIRTLKEISIKNLSYIIVKTVGYNGKVWFNLQKPDRIMHKLTDVSKLHSLGWKNTI